MKAMVFEQWKTFPTLTEVERPNPGAGEVLLKVAGAGACHSDVALFAEFDETTAPPQLGPSYVLGHENSGWIEELGPGVSGLEVGSAHLVYGPIGCGRCPACSRGQDTYCANAASMPYLGMGLGRDGGMAEYIVVPASHLVPLGDADPVAAAPLSDAALTPYHAIKKSLPALDKAGASALVIGLGGLGQTAVQILTALSGAAVIATDMKADAMKRAEANGAVTVSGGADQVDAIRELTGGRGVDAVFDFVGVDPTMALAMGSVALGGRVTIVGIGGGTYPWNFLQVPYEVELTSTYWGTLEDLWEVAGLYRAGKIAPDVERFAMKDAPEAYRLLQAGELSARAVVVPHS